MNVLLQLLDDGRVTDSQVCPYTESPTSPPHCNWHVQPWAQSHRDTKCVMPIQRGPDWVFVLLQGRTVSFRNAVIIMTSNLGSADILAASRSAAAGGGADEAFSLLTRDRVMAQVGLCAFS